MSHKNGVTVFLAIVNLILSQIIGKILDDYKCFTGILMSWLPNVGRYNPRFVIFFIRELSFNIVFYKRIVWKSCLCQQLEGSAES